MGLRQRRALIAQIEKDTKYGPVPTPDQVAAAKDRVDAGFLLLSVSNDIIAARLALLFGSGMAWGCGVERMAVTAQAGTGIVLAVNPHFVLGELDGPNPQLNCAFGLGHEASHVINHHLHVGYSGPAWDLATEIRVNHDIMRSLKCGMPEVYVNPEDPLYECKSCKAKHNASDLGANTSDCSACSSTGTLTRATEEFGINPRKMWEKCRDDLKKQGKTPPSYDEFVATDLGCMAWLSKMEKLPTPPRRRGGKGATGGRSPWPCEHHGGEPLPLDQEEVDSAAEEVLETVYRKATAEQDPRAKEALQRLHEATKGSESADKRWGLIGIGALYGEPVERRQVRYWEQWLRRQVGSRLVPGRRLIYNRRLAAIDTQLKRDPVLAYRGKTRKRAGDVICDSSGSMSADQLNWVRDRYGDEPNLELRYWCADTEMYPMDWGKPFRGRGGTDFTCIDTYLRELRRKPDFVVIITDGYVEKLVPGGDPRKLVWLITHDGDDWPARHDPPMACYRLPAPGA
jgi:hypothetical protein